MSMSEQDYQKLIKQPVDTPGTLSGHPEQDATEWHCEPEQKSNVIQFQPTKGEGK